MCENTKKFLFVERKEYILVKVFISLIYAL